MGAGGDVAEDGRLRRPASQEGGDLVEQLGFFHQEAVLGGHLHGVAQSGDAPGDDGDFLDRVGSRQAQGDDGVAQFVVGDDPALFGVDQPVFFLQAGHHALHRLLELGHAHRLFVPPDGQQGGLVDQVGEIGPHHAGGHGGELLHIEVGFGLDAPEVDPQDGLAARLVGAVHQHLAIEAPRPQQRRVQDFGAVGGGHQNDAHVGVEAVHFHQQLVEGLFALVVAGHRPDAAGLAQSVEFVDENDAGRFLFGLFEEVPHPGRPQAHEHLHKLGAAHAEKRHAAFTGNRLGEQRFTRSRRPHQQDALGHLAAQGGKAPRLP